MGIAVSLYKRVQRAKGRKDPSAAQLTSFGSVLPAYFAGATPESLAWLQKVDRAMIFRDNVVVLVNQRLQDFRVDAAVIQELQQNNLRFSIASVAETDAKDLPEELRESDAYVAQCLKDGSVVGSVVLFNKGSSIARWLPWIYEFGPSVGGMTSLRCDSDLIMQGLVCCAMRSFRIEGFQTVVLDHMSVAQRDSLSGLGFSVWRVEEKFSR
jgi:beta-N-acetylhexosaminidase